MKKIAIIQLSIIFHLSLATVASSVTFSDLYVFGDSLSDSGQLPDIFAGYPGLRATNRVDPLNSNSETAMVWSQYFSRSLGLGSLLPSNPLLGPSGNNYAYVTNRSSEILASITNTYLIQHPLANPHALYVIWGGGNDLRDIRNARVAGGTQALLIADSQATADRVVAGALALRSAGAQYVLVPNLPDIGAIPESNLLGVNYISAGNNSAQAFNGRLLSRLNASNANVIQVDVHTLFQELLNEPALYGFSNENHQIVAFDGTAFTGVPAAEGLNGANTASPDPSRYIFFDGIHPTTYAAELIAEYYQSILNAPGQISLLAEMPLNLVHSHLNSIEDHLRWLKAVSHKGDVFPFVTGGYDHLDMNDTDNTPGYNNRDYSLTAGLSYCLSDDWTAGISVGRNTAAVDIDDNGGGFDLDGLFLSLLTGIHYKIITWDTLVTVADLNYDDITRKVKLGQALRSPNGDTTGRYYGLKTSFSLDMFHKNGFTLGPLSSLNYQHVDVDGYHENGNLSTSMNFHDQVRRSLLGSLGLFSNCDIESLLGPLHTYGSITYEKEIRDDPRDVRAGLNTLPGSSFELPGYEPEEAFWRFDFSLGAEIIEDWEWVISYQILKGMRPVLLKVSV